MMNVSQPHLFNFWRSALFFALGAAGCSVGSGVTVPETETAAKWRDAPVSERCAGAPLGPNGGALTQAGEYVLEALVLPEVLVRVYVYDLYARPVPVTTVWPLQVWLKSSAGSVTVSLYEVSSFMLEEPYDPAFYLRTQGEIELFF